MLIATHILSVVLALQSSHAQPEEAADADPSAAARAPAEQPAASTQPADRSEPIRDKAHPDYIRCKTESVAGSRAKRKRTCMTNKQWSLVERRENEATKTFAGDNFAAGYN